MNASLKDKTVSGIGWTLANQLALQAITLIVGVLLARILGPKVCGLLAMVTVLTQFAFVFADMGLASALIQKKELDENDASTVFWVNLLIGLLISVVIAASAKAIARFYSQPILENVTYFVSLNFLVTSLSIVQRSLLEKNHNFKGLFFANTSAVLVSGVIAIGMAVAGFGVWSLVAQLLVRSVLTTVFLWWTSPWRPKFVVDRKALTETSRFGLPLLGTNSFNYWTRNADNLLIGRVWGDEALGLYSRSYALMLLPVNTITRVVSKVMFPSFSKIQSDADKVARSFIRIAAITSLITFPISFGMFLLAKPIVMGLFGPEWAGSVDILRVLSLLGINQSIAAFNGVVFQSQGATVIQFKWGLLFKSIVVLAILMGLPFGAFGVACSYTIASYVITIPSWVILGRVIPIRPTEIITACLPSFLATLGMGLPTLLALRLSTELSSIASLCICVPVGIVAYLGLLMYFRPSAYREAVELILPKLRDLGVLANQ